MKLFLFLLVQLHLEWTAASGPVPDGYKIHIGSTPGVYEQTIDVGKTLSITQNFDLSSPKYFAVTAYNNFGEGPKSREVGAGVPLAPGSLTVTRP